jgi:hypothetical protein
LTIVCGATLKNEGDPTLKNEGDPTLKNGGVKRDIYKERYFEIRDIKSFSINKFIERT